MGVGQVWATSMQVDQPVWGKVDRGLQMGSVAVRLDDVGRVYGHHVAVIDSQTLEYVHLENVRLTDVGASQGVSSEP